MTKTISDLIMEYFQAHPHEELEHGPVVDWVEEQYFAAHGRKPRDPWRAIRKFELRRESDELCFFWGGRITLC